MNLFVPIETIMRRESGLSVVGSIKATSFITKLASEWTGYRGSVKESGRLEKVGRVPQILSDGGMITVEALITDQQTEKKIQAGVLRGFDLEIDENYGQITDVKAVDRANDPGTETKLFKRQNTMSKGRVSPEVPALLESMGFDGQTGFAKKTYATTGTATDSRGDGGPDNEAASAVAAAEDLVRAVIQEAISLISEGPANPDPDDVLARAIKAVANRLGKPTFVDLSGDNGNPDPSLNPNGPAASRAGGYRSAGDAIEQMDGPNGFEIVKRWNATADDGGLLSKLTRADRVSVSGGSASLLKSEGSDMRKVDDGRGGFDTAKVIHEPEELLERLSARRDFRKAMPDFVITGRQEPSRGSYSPGILDLPYDTRIVNRPEDLVGKIARLHNGGGESSITKLLH